MSEGLATTRVQEENKATFTHLVRCILTSFLATFIVARCLVFTIMSRRVPDLYIYVGGTHVHHLNFGIFLLAGLGAYLILARPSQERLPRMAVLYGIGLGLTFDEFGMWLHLGGSYWQRASLDAVGVIVAVLGLIAVAPRLRRFRPRHWWTAITMGIATIVFATMLVRSLRYVERAAGPRLEMLDRTTPH